MAKQKKEFKSEIILEVKIEELSEKRKHVIQVVKYGENDPVLVKQEYYKEDESDEDWKPGKLKGLTKKDFIRLLNNKQEIKDALKG